MMFFNNIIFLIIGITLGLYFFSVILQYKKRKKIQFISQRAKQGEENAKKVLTKAGYRVVGEQVRKKTVMYIDGEICESFVQVDYLATKKNKRYIVEVKTGGQANLKIPNVRRQLFEYHHIFQVDGILFVDMNEEKIYSISFDDVVENHEIRFFVLGAGIVFLIWAFIQSFF